MRMANYIIGILCAGILLFCAWGECYSLPPRVTVTVPEQVRINSQFITLGAIAEISGEDINLVKQLKVIKLGKAPLPGAVKRISNKYIETRIRHSGVGHESLTLNLPQKVEVTVDSIVISPEEIEKMVRDFILKKAPWDGKDVTVTVSPVEGIALATGKITYKVVPRKKEDFLGTTNLSVVFMVDGQVRKKCWVNAYVDVVKDIVVSTRLLERHSIITGEDVRLEKMHLADLQSNVVTDPVEVIGKRTKRTIEANTPLRLAFLEIPPLVKRGDMVTIIAETDVLRITTRGIVTENGGKGDMVRVINVNSRKELFAKVLDARTVEVDF